jgi:hypothetical protein
VAVVAYADDVTLFVTQHDFRIIGDTVKRYEKASGVRLNIHKPKALAVAGWKCTVKDLGVDFVPNIRILGITFSNTVEGTAHNSWSWTIAQIRAQAQQAYGRNLSIAQRIKYVDNTLLATIWYTAQNLPPPET